MCEEFEKEKKYIGNLKRIDSCSFGWSRHTLYIFESVFVFVFNLYLYLYDKDYLVFVCSRELARILHLLLVRRPLPRVGGNSQFSNLIPEKKLGINVSRRNQGKGGGSLLRRVSSHL